MAVACCYSFLEKPFLFNTHHDIFGAATEGPDRKGGEGELALPEWWAHSVRAHPMAHVMGASDPIHVMGRIQSH
jgi:hypothetical protein